MEDAVRNTGSIKLEKKSSQYFCRPSIIINMIYKMNSSHFNGNNSLDWIIDFHSEVDSTSVS